MSFYRHLLGSVLLSGTIFAAATLPLAAFGSNPLAIQFDGRTVFTGQSSELASPYLGLALALSLGAGVANFTLWRCYQLSHELKQSTNQVADLKRQLAEQEALIEALKFSPTRLQASGLERFLPEESRAARSQFGAEPPRHDHPVLNPST